MVSKHMQLLEAEIGVNLLVRSTRKLSLTEAGLAFHEACVEILNRTDQAIVQARTGVEAPSGTLRVAAPIDYGAMVVAPVLQAELIPVEALSATARGSGGFGSTGR